MRRPALRRRQNKFTMHRIAVMLALGLPLWAGPPRQRVESVSTERVDFAPGGTIRIEGSTGELNVEGWDRPSVEVTVTRSAWSGDADRAKRDLDMIQVAKPAMAGAGELTIDTTHTRFPRATVDYRIRVPRDSRLVIRHGIGDVVVYDVGGDIDATNRVGGIVLQLPASSQYAIDAKNKTGGEIYSDFAGTTHYNRLILSDSLRSGAPPATHRLYLRVGIGGIAIQKMAT